MKELIAHRPLSETRFVSTFLKNIVGYDVASSDEAGEVCVKIRDTENLLAQYYACGTLKHKDFRHPHFQSDAERIELRKKIIHELIFLRRLKNDTKICLGKGGFLPFTGSVSLRKKVYLITGLPASGKSGIAERIAADTHSILIDNDYAKRKFPEFMPAYGAGLVHEESALICEGPLEDPQYKGFSVMDFAVKIRANIVLPKICPSAERLKGILQFFADNGYACFLIHVQLDREIATKRAFKRFLETDRYVPLSMIFDGYANNPTLAYFETRDLDLVKGYIRFSTENAKPRVIESSGIRIPKAWL